jgi:hypothetical protein
MFLVGDTRWYEPFVDFNDRINLSADRQIHKILKRLSSSRTSNLLQPLQIPPNVESCPKLHPPSPSKLDSHDARLSHNSTVERRDI